MQFTFRLLTVGAGRAENGIDFTGPGDWVLLKCFYEEDGQYGEFYLNLNVNTKEGELAPKDAQYGKVGAK